MDFSIKPIDAKTGIAGIKTGCIVAAVFEDRKLSSAAAELDGKGAVSAALKTTRRFSVHSKGTGRLSN